MMSMSLELKPVLSQQMRLEQRLEQKLEQKLKLELSLKQYIEQEGWFKNLVRWTDKKNRWKEFDKWGFNFKYGLVPYNKVKHVADETGPGFAHCFYNPFLGLSKGDWTLFVVEGMAPKEYEEDIALHERGEELSSGDHFFASKLEFAGIKKGNKVKEYNKWIDNNYPTKFVDLTEEVLFPILPDELREYLEQRDRRYVEEIDAAEEMIYRYPLPVSTMKKAIEYDDINENLERELKIGTGFLGLCQKAISFAETLEESEEKVNKILSDYIRAIPEEHVRILVPRRIRYAITEPLKTIVYDFDKVKHASLDVSNNFFELYDDVKKGKQIVKARYKKFL